jgi:hypothetical protein
MKPTPNRDLLAEVILERSHEPWSKYLYEHVFGSIDADAPVPDNILHFPKRISPQRRRQILLAALERDDA